MGNIGELYRILSNLEKLKSYEENWCGFGEKKPKHDCITIAEAMVKRIFEISNMNFEWTSPTDSGGIMIVGECLGMGWSVEIHDPQSIDWTIFTKDDEVIQEGVIGGVMEIDELPYHLNLIHINQIAKKKGSVSC